MQEMKDIQEEKRVMLDSVASRMGNKTIELSGICKSYGEKKLIEDFSYIFLKKDRIGIIGHNGCGKSTLLKIINGIIKPDVGTIEIGQTIKIGYFSQENEYMDESERVIDYVKEAGEYIATSDGKITASQMLERFLFDGAMQWSRIEKLSGGEKRRLYLLRVLMEAPNVLILDEPTRGIDVGAKVEIYNLMNQLKKQGIAVMFVSSEMPEVLGIADRVIVMCDGKITGEVMAKETSQNEVLKFATEFEKKQQVS